MVIEHKEFRPNNFLFFCLAAFYALRFGVILFIWLPGHPWRMKKDKIHTCTKMPEFIQKISRKKKTVWLETLTNSTAGSVFSLLFVHSINGGWSAAWDRETDWPATAEIGYEKNRFSSGGWWNIIFSFRWINSYCSHEQNKNHLRAVAFVAMWTNWVAFLCSAFHRPRRRSGSSIVVLGADDSLTSRYSIDDYIKSDNIDHHHSGSNEQDAQYLEMLTMLSVNQDNGKCADESKSGRRITQKHIRCTMKWLRCGRNQNFRFSFIASVRVVWTSCTLKLNYALCSTGPHREMAVDVPDSFIARNKTPPRYPPPRPTSQTQVIILCFFLYPAHHKMLEFLCFSKLQCSIWQFATIAEEQLISFTSDSEARWF